jgi:hypothetical protein
MSCAQVSPLRFPLRLISAERKQFAAKAWVSGEDHLDERRGAAVTIAGWAAADIGGVEGVRVDDWMLK